VTGLALALAWTSTLAFVGWVQWLRDRKGADVAGTIRAISVATATQADTIRQLKVDVSECRTIVDNLSLRIGLTSKR
jgi:hypothetical protein